MEIKRSVSANVQEWLTSWGFIANPFESVEAGQEINQVPKLENYFVEPPFYDQLLSQQRSTLVFAPRGGGKSATRVMLEGECQPHKYHSSIFAVSFTDFSAFTENVTDIPTLTLGKYLPNILSKSISTLIQATGNLLLYGNKIEQTQIDELCYWIKNYKPEYLEGRYLSYLLKRFAPSINKDLLNTWVELVQENKLHLPNASPEISAQVKLWSFLKNGRPVTPLFPLGSPSQIMTAFVNFVMNILTLDKKRCTGMYLLIDGVDEYHVTQKNPQASAAVLRPLLSNLHFLEIPNFAAKFFLPIEHRAALEPEARKERLQTYTIDWDSDQVRQEYLHDLLEKRLIAFSNGAVANIGMMCDAALRHVIDDYLIMEGKRAPRDLLLLGQYLFIEHCRIKQEGKSLIQSGTWERARQSFRGTQQVTISVTATSSIDPPVAQSLNRKTSTVPVLHIDLQARRIYIGNVEVEELTEFEYRLLTYLYSRKGQKCTRDEIIKYVYETDTDITDQSLGSLVYRLRKKIETSSPPQYLKTAPRLGYYLDNTD